MSDKPLPFVITDRRRINSDGDLRPDAEPAPNRDADRQSPAEAKPASKPDFKADSKVEPIFPPSSHSAPPGIPHLASDTAEEALPGVAEDDDAPADPNLPPAPTPEQMEQSRLAFQATADRLDLAIRAANPGADHPPALTFESLIQSVYMQTIMQLGGATPEGQQPQVDLIGARQSIDMLGLLSEKTAGNLSSTEKTFLDSALFEVRLGYLEITQALARSAQQRAQQTPGAPTQPPPRPGPSIVR